jgi:hypothetical protein
MALQLAVGPGTVLLYDYSRGGFQPPGCWRSNSHGCVEHVSPLEGIRLDIDGSDRARIRAEKAIIVALAGPAAQRRYNPRSLRSWHASSDHDWAAELALRLNNSSEAANAYLRWLEIRAADLVSVSWPLIDVVATALLDRGMLHASEVSDAILGAMRALTRERLSEGADA